jgi:TrmH family RNA methyltransferase
VAWPPVLEGREIAPHSVTPRKSRSETISERHNAGIRRIRKLKVREERERAGVFFVEGIRFVAQAVQHHAEIETLLVAPKLLVHPFGQKLARQMRRGGTPCLEVTPEVFYSLSQAEETQGIGAVVRQRWERLERVKPSEGLCWVALDAVQFAGNLGTILRTCDAVGAAGVILIGPTIDPYHPAAVRASMGGMFSQRFVRTSCAEFAAWKQRHGCMLVGTSPAAPIDYHAVAYQAPIVLFMGGEKRGLPPGYQSLCDVMVKIPMVGQSDSLNLAVATSVMLYELFNQRRAGSQV